MNKGSLNQVFFIFVHITLENVLHWAEQTFKGVTLDIHNSAIGFGFNACLTNCVLYQCDLTKVISIMILKHFFGLWGRCLSFFSNQLSFRNDVESVALITLFDDIASSFVLLLLQGITKLFFFIRVDFSQNLNLGKNVWKVFSFFCSSFLNNVIESGSI